MSPSVYAAPFEPSPGHEAWLLVRETADGLARVPVVSDWLLVCAVSDGSPHTTKSKAESLAMFWRWATDKDLDPNRISATQFALFVAALANVPKEYDLTSPVRALPDDDRLRLDSTVRLRVIYIKAFYEWAHKNGRMSSTAAQAVTGFKTPPAPRGTRVTRLSSEQVQALVNAPLHPRDRFIVECMYGCGLREGEVLGLNMADLCLNTEMASMWDCPTPDCGAHLHVRRRTLPGRIRSKSKIERPVPMPRRVVHAFRDLQAWAFENCPDLVDRPHLISSLAGPTRGQRMTLSGFSSMWERQVQTVPGLGQADPHELRHTFASELLDAGVPSFTVQELLGHQSPQSTMIYTHAHMVSLVNAVNELSAYRVEHLGLSA